MGKSSGATNIIAPAFRANEGVVVNVNVRREIRTDGSTHTAFGIDLTSAHVPERRYAADVCEVKFVNGDLRIVFGQPQFIGTKLRTALTVRMNPQAARQFVELVDKMDDPGLPAILDNMGISGEKLVVINEEPIQVVELVANIGMVGVAGYETCVDFYYSSPFGIRDFDKHKKMAIEPVVRVDLRTSLFTSIVDEMRELIPRFPPQSDQGD